MLFRSKVRLLRFPLLLRLLIAAPAALHAASECDGWQTRRPEWIFCDDFDKGGALLAPGRYFEYNDNKGDFKPVAGSGLHGSTGMRALWQSAEVDAGNLKLGFGRAPGTYFSKGIRTEADFREVYYRLFVRLQKGWKGNPYKLSRATVLAKTDWSQAMIAHLWGDRGDRLQLDPVSCTDAAGAVKCSGYNDFNNMEWIGAKAGATPVYNGSYDETWLCVETHVKLNDAGQANGVHEYWIGDTREARREGLDFLGGYKAYGINGVFFENYWNSGSPQAQERFFDNIVVSTKRIGCAEETGAPSSLLPGPAGETRAKSRRIGILGYDGSPAADAFEEIRSLTGRKIAPESGP
ncbi:MAG TPA: hypothetical protein VJ385_17000 [Fibrobacteria bacterium]|nr:hypothetical protein [Fibrobacteria bacterium]